MTKTSTTIIPNCFLYPGIQMMVPPGNDLGGTLFGLQRAQSFRILDFGHWDLFEPALVRLVWCIPLSVSSLEIEAINTSGVKSVWARDLVFGILIFELTYTC
jgi:hypothetical protein